MPSFKYAARDAHGGAVAGVIDATNQAEAIAQLRSRSLTVLNVNPASLIERVTALFAGGGSRAKAKGDDLIVFTRQMATMVAAGIPLLEALTIMTEQIEEPGFKQVITRVAERVKGGGDLSESMSQFPRIFTRIYINMVKAGEASGELDTILARLADYQEASAALKREIKSAMTYPVISLTLVFGITIFLLTVIVPRFVPIFTSLGVPLPLPTRILMGVAVTMQQYFLYFALGAAALVVAAILYKRTKTGGKHFDWLTLHLPVFGPLFRKVAISRFARTFATLIQSGVPILSALEIVASTSGNRVIEDAVLSATSNVKQGETLAEPLSRSGVFPPMVTRMIAVGEKSGALEQLLEKISEFYDQQVKTTVESLTALIEPIMISLMGLMVGSIVISIFLPIIKIQQVVTPK
jgi:type IV pilus assembly protein PilC